MSCKCHSMLTIFTLAIILTAATNPAITYPTYLQAGTTSPLLQMVYHCSTMWDPGQVRN
jgi:hypothetical protein